MRIIYNEWARYINNLQINSVSYHKGIWSIGVRKKYKLFGGDLNNNNPFLKELNLKPYL